MTEKRLPRPYMTILVAFEDSGGCGDLDMHGRVTVGDTKHPMAGDASAWLQLVAHGLVAGEGGSLLTTELGRQTVAEHRAGLTREVGR